MAIASDGSYAGLLSGGCLEHDLSEYAKSVIETGEPRTVTYNTGGDDDALWGLGVGCEGAMTILLLRIGPAEGWQPIGHLADALSAYRRTAVGVVVESRSAQFPAGAVLLPGTAPPHFAAAVSDLLNRVARCGDPEWLEPDGLRLFALPLALPPRLLLLGGGPDALPVVDLAGRLAWKVTVYDHRPSYAKDSHFPAADRVVLARPEELARTLDLASYEAAVIMSHHLPSDLEYLRALAHGPIGYIGLLGPPHRRDRLLADLGADAARLGERLRAPVGFHLGGRTPESIALAIIAEIHAYLHRGSAASRDTTTPKDPAALPKDPAASMHRAEA